MVEHIIPESLGNKDHVLPAGVVCDPCNSYFARKIEGPLLNSDFFRHLRFRNTVCNKKGRVPTIKALSLPGGVIVEIMRDEKGKSIYASREKDESRFIKSIATSEKWTLLIPEPPSPEPQMISRFLGKVAMETLAKTALAVPDGLSEIATPPTT